MTARHRSVFFGATSSVHNWERVGALLAAILRRVVHIPALRYVDDFFGVEAAALAQHTNECGLCHSPPRSARRADARTAVRCVARVIRCLLGADSMKEKKMAHGNPLVILGLRIEARSGTAPAQRVVPDATQAQPDGITARPAPEKVKLWQKRIGDALDSGTLQVGLAKKLAGALSWGASALFRRVGRAMLRRAPSGRCASLACRAGGGQALVRARPRPQLQAERARLGRTTLVAGF